MPLGRKMGRAEGLTSCGSCGREKILMHSWVIFVRLLWRNKLRAGGYKFTSSILHEIWLPGGHRGRDFQSKITKLQEKSVA